MAMSNNQMVNHSDFRTWFHGSTSDRQVTSICWLSRRIWRQQDLWDRRGIFRLIFLTCSDCFVRHQNCEKYREVLVKSWLKFLNQGYTNMFKLFVETQLIKLCNSLCNRSNPQKRDQLMDLRKRQMGPILFAELVYNML